MTNPYRIDGPALISFSGGRTSGYMLRQILDAHGGDLPSDVHVVFADTGQEHPATYAFVRDVGEWLGVEIHTVAYPKGEHATPFDALIAKKKYLPNPRQRFCTQWLKVEQFRAFMIERGCDQWTNWIGIRADEPVRYHDLSRRDDDEPWDNVMPLYHAGVTRRDVLRFWQRTNVRFTVPPGCGNCVGCFQKGLPTLIAVEQQHPGSLRWYAEKETEVGGFFRPPHRRPSYAKIIETARDQGQLPLEDDVDDGLPCMCHD